MARKRRKRRRRGCPCGSGRPYPACCRPYHRGDKQPENARRLMESRFAAYAVEEVDYIIDTTDPDSAASEDDTSAWRESIGRFSESTDFRGLEVLAFEEDGDRATVRFHANLSRDGEDASFEERSTFRRVDGTWLYASGEQID